MSMSIGPRKGGVCADINVTPFADIMIVLLIIFMVATTALDKDDASACLPRSTRASSRSRRCIVKIMRDGRAADGRDRACWTRTMLRDRARGSVCRDGDQRPVQIQADDGPRLRAGGARAGRGARARAPRSIVLRTQPGAQTTRKP